MLSVAFSWQIMKWHWRKMHTPDRSGMQTEKATHKALRTHKTMKQVPVCSWSRDGHFHGKEEEKQNEGIKRTHRSSVNPTKKKNMKHTASSICTPVLFYSMVSHKLVSSTQYMKPYSQKSINSEYSVRSWQTQGHLKRFLFRQAVVLPFQKLYDHVSVKHFKSFVLK